MSKPLKIRAWHKERKLWFLEKDIESLNFETKVLGVYSTEGFQHIRLSDLEVVQFTGLIDENGAEIYEGDIFKREFEVGRNVYDEATLGFVDFEIEDAGYFIGVVSYRPSQGFILNKCQKFNDDGELQETKNGINIYPKRGRVIGNIYENPELLEAANEKR